MKVKLNNKGVTLLEVIIAVAIAAVVSTLIVTMIVSSSNMFSRESKVIDGQNEMQVVQNQITDRFREAKEINVVKCGDAVRIYTGEVDLDTNKLVVEGSGVKYTDCIITYVDNKLYVTNSYMTTIPEGYLLADDVSQFEISIATDAEAYTQYETDDMNNPYEVTKYYYDNPISVTIKMDIGTGDAKKNADLTVKLRNEIDVYRTYSVTDFSSLLKGVTPTELDLR